MKSGSADVAERLARNRPTHGHRHRDRERRHAEPRSARVALREPLANARVRRHRHDADRARGEKERHPRQEKAKLFVGNERVRDEVDEDRKGEDGRAPRRHESAEREHDDGPARGREEHARVVGEGLRSPSGRAALEDTEAEVENERRERFAPRNPIEGTAADARPHRRERENARAFPPFRGGEPREKHESEETVLITAEDGEADGQAGERRAASLALCLDTGFAAREEERAQRDQPTVSLLRPVEPISRA